MVDSRLVWRPRLHLPHLTWSSHPEWCHLAYMIEANSGQTLGLLGDPDGQIQMLVIALLLLPKSPPRGAVSFIGHFLPAVSNVSLSFSQATITFLKC